MNPVRVMIVEDSPTVRDFLVGAVESDPRLRVVLSCDTAEHAIERLNQAAPDVISMDIQLPGMNGLEATRRIMELRPTPIVIVSRTIQADEIETTMEALRAGAVSAVEKPAGGLAQDSGALAARICRELAVMSQVKVIRQRFNSRQRQERLTSRNRATQSNFASTLARMVGITASTGGPRAVEIVLTGLGADFPAPILLVQHMTPSFQHGFVTWLDRIAPQTVVEAEHGQIPKPGHVYVAPAETHLRYCRDRLWLEKGELISGQRPSGTVLFESLADSLGSEAIGVLLTGMGNDGAEGLWAMRQAGAWTIAEDALTAVVYGMPGAAEQLGAVCRLLPVDAIAAEIRRFAVNRVEASA